jgi:hypothetical protein
LRVRDRIPTWGVVLSWLALWALSLVLILLYVGRVAFDEVIFAALGSIASATGSKLVLEAHIAPLKAWLAFGSAILCGAIAFL